MMNDSDKRVGEKPVPDDVLKQMNADQLIAYRGMQGFGWCFKFVRRPLFQRLVFVITHPDTNTMAVIEEDGSINKEHNIQLRNRDALAEQELSYATA